MISKKNYNYYLIIKHFFRYVLAILPTILFIYLAILSVIAPICEEHYIYSISDYSYHTLSKICHQYPTRCLWIMNRPMGLCSRCFAIYVSFALSLVCFLSLKVNRNILPLLFICLLPLLCDGITQYYNIRESNNILRVVSGIFFGIGASGIYMYFVLFIGKIDELKSNFSLWRWVNMTTGISLIALTNLYGIFVILF